MPPAVRSTAACTAFSHQELLDLMEFLSGQHALVVATSVHAGSAVTKTGRAVPMRATLRTALNFCKENSKPSVNSKSCTPTCARDSTCTSSCIHSCTSTFWCPCLAHHANTELFICDHDTLVDYAGVQKQHLCSSCVWTLDILIIVAEQTQQCKSMRCRCASRKNLLDRLISDLLVWYMFTRVHACS